MRILIADDDAKIAAFIERGLTEAGYEVDVAHDGSEAGMKAVLHEYDLLLLDVVMPGRTGLDIVRDVRAREMSVPILMLSGKDAQDDIVHGLDVGADDYLTKPFGFEELAARVRALLRRGRGGRPSRLVYHDLQLDRLERWAMRRGRKLDLTEKELELLEFLMLNVERVIRRTELLEKVWDLSFDPMSNVVDVHISHLRQKLRGEADEEDLIHTVRGVGYLFRAGSRE